MSTKDLLASLTDPYKQQLVSVARRVFERFDERPEWQVRGLLNDIDEVLKGGGTPSLSHVERVAVLEAWKDEAPRAEGFDYRWAAARSRADSPSVTELEADGWTVEHIDPRYGTRLMRKALP